MTHRSVARLMVGLLAVVLSAAGAPSAFGSGEPQDSFLYKNFVRASEVREGSLPRNGAVSMNGEAALRISA